jgi:hypothetical protein
MLREKIKGWTRNIEVDMKRYKTKILPDIDKLDLLAEQQPPTLIEGERRKEMSIKIE